MYGGCGDEASRFGLLVGDERAEAEVEELEDDAEPRGTAGTGEGLVDILYDCRGERGIRGNVDHDIRWPLEELAGRAGSGGEI